jgi:cytochrome P450
MTLTIGHLAGRSWRVPKTLLLRRMLRFRAYMAVLRHLPPSFLPTSNLLLLTRHEDVLDVLHRDSDFGVPYLPKMEALGAKFILGLDRSPALLAQRTTLFGALNGPNEVDLEALTRAETQRALLGCGGRIDIVNDLMPPVLRGSVGAYLGTGPMDPRQFGEARDVFWEVFINPLEDPAVRAMGEEAAARLVSVVGQRVADRRALPVPNGSAPTDVLGHLLRVERDHPDRALPAEELAPSLIGLLIAWVTSVSRTMAFTFDELLRWPQAIELGRRRAREGDADGVRAVLEEAMRLQPSVPAIERVCLQDSQAGGRRVRRGGRVLVALTSAMMDPKAIAEAKTFKAPRDARERNEDDRDEQVYLYYGAGLHRCLGRELSLRQMTAVAMELLTQPGLRRRGSMRLSPFNPYPRKLVVEFDRP